MIDDHAIRSTLPVQTFKEKLYDFCLGAIVTLVLVLACAFTAAVVVTLALYFLGVF
jgi:hypothetical protein